MVLLERRVYRDLLCLQFRAGVQTDALVGESKGVQTSVHGVHVGHLHPNKAVPGNHILEKKATVLPENQYK